MDLYNLGVSLHSGQTQDHSDFKLPTNFFLFLPLNAYWKTHCLLRKYTCALPKVFPPPLPEPPITWNIPFALEKQILSRNSQLWFFISNFPCLTWRVKSGNASSLTPERCLQSFLCDPVGGWEVLRASGSGKKTSQVSDDGDPKGLVKSRKTAVVSFMALLCLPPFRDFYRNSLKLVMTKQTLQMLGGLHCTGVLFGSLSLTAASAASSMLLI